MVAIDGMADRLAHFLLVERRFRLHGQEHDFYGIRADNFQVCRFLHPLAEVRRDELGDLDFAVQQGRDPLFGFSHDAIDNFVRRVRAFFCFRMIRPLGDHHSLAGNELLKPVRPSAHHVFLVGRLFAVFVVRGFAGDDQPVADKTQERRGRLIGGELDGVFVHRLGFDDRTGDRGLLLGLRIVDDPRHHGVDHIVRGDRRAIVEFVVLVQIKKPRRRVLDFPTICQPSLEVPFLVIVSAKGAGDLAPDAVQERNAVAVRVVGLDGFRDSDGDAGLSGDMARG